MEELVTLDTAKARLRISHDSEDDDLQLMLEEAQAAVVEYLNQRRSDGEDWLAEMEAWTEDTVPKQVRAAILRMFGDLFRNRGDDDPANEPKLDLHGDLPPRVRSLLARLRDPALA